MWSSQLRTPGSGTVTVTTPMPEKAPAGIRTVQSPFFKTPPMSPFTVPDTIREVVESPEPGGLGSTDRAGDWPEGCSGERGADEHPARTISIATIGSVLMRCPRIDIKQVPPLNRVV